MFESIYSRIRDAFSKAKISFQKPSLPVQQEIWEYNRVRILWYSFAIMLAFSALALASLFIKSITHNLASYVLVAFLGLGLLLGSYSVTKKNPKQSTTFAYLFVFLMLTYSGYLGTYLSPDNSATAFCVLLMVVPLLFIMDTLRMIILSCAAVALFCFVVPQVKSPDLASTDIVNAVAYLVLSCIINTSTQSTMRMNIVQRHFIEHERDTDHLTGLLAKNAFELQVTRFLEQEDARGCLIVMDLDKFKSINDTYGHAVGDQVLRDAGHCLQRSFRTYDIKGRFGGDEYTVFLPGVTDPKIAQMCIERWMNALKEISLPDDRFHVGGSAGAAYTIQGNHSYDSLFRDADKRLYETKQIHHRMMQG